MPGPGDIILRLTEVSSETPEEDLATTLKRLFVGRALRSEHIVAKDNLGTQAGLVAAASLLVDYVLTVAVSVSAGVAAITSAVQGTRFSFLHEHRVIICISFVFFIAIINLRGVRESGAFFAGPTYLFIFSMLTLIVVGFFHYYTTHQVMPVPEKLYFDPSVESVAHHLLTGGALLWLLMRAFAAGCTALTGV